MKNRAFFVLFAVSVFAGTDGVAGVSSLNTGSKIRPVSQYGIIQNVQDYSTNPFWKSNSPYNQNFPQPVYVTGPELTTSDCQSTVGALISSYCFANNNCSGMRIADVRPIIMLQLARMPGHNYASNCSGYIDAEFDSYIDKYSATIPTSAVTFPGATVANPKYDAPEFKLENPYERKDGTWNGEEWQKEKKERAQELKDLQAANGLGNEKLAKADFPTTFADLSFTEQMDVKKEGYDQFSGSSAYNPIQIEKEDDYYNRMMRSFCITNPNDPRCKKNSASNSSGGNGSGVGQQPDDGVIRLTLK